VENRELTTRFFLVSKSIIYQQRVDHEKEGSARQYGYIAKGLKFFAQRFFRRTETAKEGVQGGL
jgi:hypothetical protein